MPGRPSRRRRCCPRLPWPRQRSARRAASNASRRRRAMDGDRRVARQARRGVASGARPARRLRPRRPDRLLDRRLALALEPAVACRARLRRAARRIRPSRPVMDTPSSSAAGAAGGRTVQRHDRDRRRRRRPAGHRREAHRAHGWQLRRLHGQLGGRSDGTLPRHRDPRLTLGAARFSRHHRHWGVVGAGDGRPVSRPVALHRPLPIRASGQRSARRCS